MTNPAAVPSLPQQAASRRQLRICIASHDFIGPVRNGGVGTAFTSLAEALADDGHAVTLLYLSGQHCEGPQPLSHWIEHYARRGIRFVPLPRVSGLKLDASPNIAQAFEAHQWLLGQEFDVVHFSEWRAPGYFAIQAKHQGLAHARTHLCVHAHGPTLWSLLSNGEYLSQIPELEFDFMERESVRHADTLVSPSRYLLGWMREQNWTLPTRTFVQQYVRPAAARPPVAGGVSGPRAVRELVFFGRLEVRKGLVLFCDALDRLAADPAMAGLSLTFLGKLTPIHDVPGADYLQSRAAKWPWPWQVISDRDQYGAIDYLQGEGRAAVIPSMVDNLPNTVLECLGAGVPFLASTTGGIPEMLAPDDAGEMLFPLSAGPFAEKLRQAVREGLRPARFAVEPTANHRAWLDWHRGEIATLTATAPAPVQAATGEPPLVSICLSHFNRPDYLRQALDSIRAQDYPRCEVVLIDDASSKPEAVAYIDSLEPEFKRRNWILLRNREELFVGAARNVAARHARGEYLKFMDDDNVAKPHEVSTFVRVARHTQADIVTCALDFFGDATPPKPGQKPLQRFLFLGPALAASALRNYLGDTNMLIRREVFLGVGGFHEERRVGNEDWKLIAGAVLRGHKLETISDSLVWYRRTGTGENASVQNSLQKGHLQNIQPFLEAVPPELRNLVLFAQGASLRRTVVDEQVLNHLVQLTVLWKAKLEAAKIFLEAGQAEIARQLLIDGVKAVETCRNPRIILEAILGIGPVLGLVDPGRARFLLGLAAKSAQGYGRTAELAQAQRLIAEIDARVAVPA